MSTPVRRRVGLALGVQFVHGLFQAIVVATLGGRGRLAASVLGIAAAVIALLASYRYVMRAVAERPTDVNDVARSPAPTAVEAAPSESHGSVLADGSGARNAGSDDAILEAYDAYVDRSRETVDAALVGDFDRRLDEDAPSESLIAFSRRQNELLDVFETTTATASQFSSGLVGSAEQVVSATEAVQSASENVAEAVQGMSDVSHEQHDQIRTIVEEIDDLSATIEEIAASTDQITAQARETERRTAEGLEAGRDAYGAIERTEDRIDEVVGTVDELDEQMVEIGQVVDTIDDIADQTNILALNASIEAAKASEDGAGFAVVASEVKGLAEQTQEATDEIERMIADAQEQTRKTVTEITAMQAVIEDGMAAFDDGIDSLESVEEHVEQTVDGVSEINEATDHQASSTEEIASIAEDVAAASGENVEEAERVAAIAEEQTLALGEMSVQTKMLSMRSTQLVALFEEYDTEA
ncbi:methyl-accepting chemotaxis protein [Natrarchaeobius sp. A-rgal3]|uniref:methyl-accepting chemotaxis protein n=1 Tax=Natrarchaeobius versutus TaxID=1679078 RepID=UPI00351032C9